MRQRTSLSPTNDPLWISYLGGGTHHFPYCLTIEPTDFSCTVGGYTDDPAFDALNWPGHYFQDSYNVDQDGVSQDAFVVRFNNDQVRVWSSLFGGNAGGGGEPQNIRAVLDLAGSVYAVGYTSMPEAAPGNYFPLDGEENSGYFFNPHYNYDGSAGGFTDGFVTDFCDETTVGVSELPASQGTSHFQIAWSPSGRYRLIGLADGAHRLRVYDAHGRLVQDNQVQSQAAQTSWMSLQNTASALYFVLVDEALTGRLVPIR